MARKGHPWYRKSHHMWTFTGPDGKQIPTGITDPSDLEGAIRERQRILDEMADIIAAKLAAGGSRIHRRTVTEAIPDFLAKKKAKICPGAHRLYLFALDLHFRGRFGDRVIPTLTAEEIEEWSEGFGWSNSYRHNVLGAISTFLRWAKHPLPLKKPPKESRGGETVLSDEQFAKVLAAYDAKYGAGDFRELLTVIRETGARPQEVAQLKVDTVDWSNACARLKVHKGAKRGQLRTLHFSEAAMATLLAQKEKHRSGHLFRSRYGSVYKEKMIVQNLQRISERVGFRAIAYGLGRHSFATKALVNGVPDTVVAAILGHKDTKMIHANYGHVGEQARALKSAIEMVSKKPA
jgi:integrase